MPWHGAFSAVKKEVIPVFAGMVVLLRRDSSLVECFLPPVHVSPSCCLPECGML